MLPEWASTCLRCPSTGSSLAFATVEQLELMSKRFQAGTLRNRLGQKLAQPPSNGLVNADATLLYPVHKTIPILMVDEAISLFGDDKI